METRYFKQKRNDTIIETRICYQDIYHVFGDSIILGSCGAAYTTVYQPCSVNQALKSEGV